jgi:hypothetical protein
MEKRGFTVRPRTVALAAGVAIALAATPSFGRGVDAGLNMGRPFSESGAAFFVQKYYLPERAQRNAWENQELDLYVASPFWRKVIFPQQMVYLHFSPPSVVQLRFMGLMLVRATSPCQSNVFPVG